MQRISVIDTHTGGEPTRVVISGGPDLGSGSMADRLAVFRDRHDTFRTAVVGEPRGSDVLVGAILLPPGRSLVCGRSHLLQQRRLPRHVRPRHDRRGRGAGPPGPHRTGLASARNAGRHGHRQPRRPKSRHDRQRRKLSPDQGGQGRRARARTLTRATSPGAVTGSSSCMSMEKP